MTLKTFVPPVFVSFVFLLLTFPLFYFVYKYGDPEPLAHDFFQYYRLYKDWDIANVNAAFNMRLAGSAIVHLFYKAGFSYETVTAFDKYISWGFDKEVFFCAVFFNYLCVAGTCVALFSLLRVHFKNNLLSFCGALLYLLGFGTIFYEMMPLTDAFSVLLFVIALRLYMNKNYLVLVPLLIFILQREYVLLAIGLLALADYVYFRQKYYVIVLVFSVICFTTYYILRKTVFYTPALDFQASPGYMLETLFSKNYPVADLIKQTAMTMNLVFIYFGLVLYKFYRKLPIHRFNLLKLLLLFAQVCIVSLAAGHGNNTGRYFYIVVPLVIFWTIEEVKGLVKLEGLNKAEG